MRIDFFTYGTVRETVDARTALLLLLQPGGGNGDLGFEKLKLIFRTTSEYLVIRLFISPVLQNNLNSEDQSICNNFI